MSDDPLAAFIARSLNAEVSDVRSVVVSKDARTELERITFRQNGAERTLLLKRVPPSESLEVQLLPFLARKSERVPRVRSRGIPPLAVPAWPWVLIEDVLAAPSACEGDPGEIVRAKAEIELAVAKDGPALRAVGVPVRSPAQLVELAAPALPDDTALADARRAAEALAAWPLSLCHGDLRCANALVVERGVLLVEWRGAHLGCALLDIARLAADVERGNKDAAGDLWRLYAELVRVPLTGELIDAAAILDGAQRSVLSG